MRNIKRMYEEETREMLKECMRKRLEKGYLQDRVIFNYHSSHFIIGQNATKKTIIQNPCISNITLNGYQVL